MQKVALFVALRSVRTLRGALTGQKSWLELVCVLFAYCTFPQRLAEGGLASLSCWLTHSEFGQECVDLELTRRR